MDTATQEADRTSGQFSRPSKVTQVVLCLLLTATAARLSTTPEPTIYSSTECKQLTRSDVTALIYIVNTGYGMYHLLSRIK